MKITTTVENLALNNLYEHARTLPITMSLPLSKAIQSLERGNYKDTLTHFLDFFEMSVQWINCYFLGLACSIEGGGTLKGIARAVRMIDGKRPLSFGDSVNELFNPLLDAMQRTFPQHPLVVALTANVKSRKYDLLAGSAKEAGIIKIRNDYKGHSTSRSEDIYRGVVKIVLPKAQAFVKGLLPLADADIYTVVSNGDTIGLHGEWKRAELPSFYPKTPYHYYVGFQGYGIVDLYPLAIQKDDKYVFLFQTLKGEAVKYESSDENIHGFETERFNREFDLYLQRLLPGFDIAKEQNWNELCQCMSSHSTDFMLHMQREKKYNGELFVDRKNLSELLLKFTDSPQTILPLSGDAGQGKTNQICNWTATFLDNGTPVLVFSSSSFSDASLGDSLKKIFHASGRRPVRYILNHLHSKAEENGENVFFFFDAINECLQYKTSGENSPDYMENEFAPLLLYNEILDCIVDKSYPRFKIVTTCRSYTWKNQIRPNINLPQELVFGVEDEEIASVVGFNDEETEIAYRKYGDLYQMSTPFEELDRRIMLRLRDPLTLKFASSNYVGNQLSSDVASYTSVSLFEKMVSDIRDRSFAGRRQCELLDEMSRIFLLSYLNGTPTGSISNSALRSACNDPDDDLHRLAMMVYKQDGLTVAYTELRNKPDRPILREVDKLVDGKPVKSIEFIYERFLEYMMARVFLEDKPCPATEDFVKAFQEAHINVVFIGAMRNALIMHIMKTADFSILKNLIAGYKEDMGIMQLVNDVLDVLIRENFEPQMFQLLDEMTTEMPADKELIPEFNRVKQEIASNKATSETILRHNELLGSLSSIMNLRNTAGVAVNNMLLSDFFNEGLYSNNLFDMLWRLIMDDIVDVSNETCKFIYYLSIRTSTNSYSPLKENLTKRVVTEMYSELKSRSIAGNVMRGKERKKSMIFMETATRLATLLIIDATIAPKQDTAMIREMLSEIREMASYFTWNYRLIRIVMPFLQTIMRKQITFQSVYVNNAVEYQGFWNDNIVPADAPENEWSRKMLRNAMEFVGFYTRHHKALSSPRCREEMKKFEEFIPVVLSAYNSGCSFSYFIMERLLIIMGCADWNLVSPVYHSMLNEKMRGYEWFDYMQMSLLYSLMHLDVNTSGKNKEILRLITEESRDWTLRCRGLFKARHSHKANPTGMYKRNVINWYCVAYCSHSGDNKPHGDDALPVPLLYELIDIAVADNDKELLFHLLDNISELISDFGYILTALDALRYVMTKFETPESVACLNSCDCNGNRFSGVELEAKVGSVLSTAKTYYPAATDAFLRSDIIGLKFPGVETYREEILNYHPVGETLSDLFTHKFGNFLLWSLLHEKEVGDFAYEAVCSAIDSKDCFAWFDQVIRILCRRMFNVKI